MEAAVTAFFDYVANDTGAFRLVFESDLTNEPAVREHVERVTLECADLIAHVIRDDTGLPEEAARLLAVSLVGMAQVSARFWLTEAGGIARNQASALVSGLAWRGIRGYPLTTTTEPPRATPSRTSPPDLKEYRPWRSRSASSTPTASS